MKSERKYYLIAGVIICASAIFIIINMFRSGPSIVSTKSVTFKLEKTFGAETEPKEAMLSGVYGMITDVNGNIYFVDNGKRLASFSSDGSLRWQIDKNGKGPGDIQNAGALATDGVKFLYLSNIYRSRIDKFDLDGNFLSSYNTAGRLTELIGFIKPNLLIISNSIMGSISCEIVALDVNNNFKISNKFVVDQTGSLKLSKGVGLGFDVGVSEDNIVAGSIADYNLYFYNIDGKVVKEIKKLLKNVTFAFVGKDMAGCAGGISIPYKIKGNYYFVNMLASTNVAEISQLMKKDFKVEFETTIDIFSEAGELVFSQKNDGLVNPEIGDPIYSDSEGFLYTFKEMPYPHICKYQVIISENK